MSDSAFDKLTCLYTKHWFISAFLVLTIISIIFTIADPENKYVVGRQLVTTLYLVIHLVIVLVKSDVCKKFFFEKEIDYYGPLYEARKYNELKTHSSLLTTPVSELKLNSSIVAPEK